MAKSRYFYRGKDGQMKRFVFCIGCGAGPFKEEDEGKIFDEISPHVHYCKKCIKMYKIGEKKVVQKTAGRYIPKKEKKVVVDDLVLAPEIAPEVEVGIELEGEPE